MLAQLEAQGDRHVGSRAGSLPLARASDPGVSIVRQPSYFFNHLDFNTTRPTVGDPIVRQALRMAIDRRTIIEKIGRGVGILQEVTTPKTAPYNVTSIPLVPFDIAKANELLEKDGWTRGPDGIRQKNGARLALDFRDDRRRARRRRTDRADSCDVEADRRRYHRAALSAGADVRAAPARAASSTRTSGT